MNSFDNCAAVEPRYLATDSFAAETREAQGFTTEDMLWALGIWSVILTLSPVIVFYVLMVA